MQAWYAREPWWQSKGDRLTPRWIDGSVLSRLLTASQIPDKFYCPAQENMKNARVGPKKTDSPHEDRWLTSGFCCPAPNMKTFGKTRHFVWYYDTNLTEVLQYSVATIETGLQSSCVGLLWFEDLQRIQKNNGSNGISEYPCTNRSAASACFVHVLLRCHSSGDVEWVM